MVYRLPHESVSPYRFPLCSCDSRRHAGCVLDAAQQNVVDRNVDELDEEADKAHDEEPHARGISYPGKLCNKFRT